MLLYFECIIACNSLISTLAFMLHQITFDSKEKTRLVFKSAFPALCIKTDLNIRLKISALQLKNK